ncbi:MAG TPA: hypothetical protein VL422_10295 [Miltoncostaea sp.]|nr:hypothetical protein [Miltoncostaea sp.]
MSDYIDLDALWRVAVLSAVFAVGVAGLYALGLRAMVAGRDGAVPGRGRRAAAYACFGLCAVVVLLGIKVMLDK